MGNLPKEILDVVAKQVSEKLVSDIKSITPFFTYTSKVQFLKFGELKKAGFSKEEALELCKGPLFVDMSTRGGKED